MIRARIHVTLKSGILDPEGAGHPAIVGDSGVFQRE